MPFTEDDYDGLPPDNSGNCAQMLHEQPCIVRMLGDLAHVANGVDVAYNLSSFLHALQEKVKNGKSKISERQLTELRDALSAASTVILGLGSKYYSVRFARKAFESTNSLVKNWACDDIYLDSDDHAYVRCLRNICHNISLIEDIESRTAERRSKTINALLISQELAGEPVPLSQGFNSYTKTVSGLRLGSPYGG